MMRRTHRSVLLVRDHRSSEKWEKGRHAPKLGNPRYKPVLVHVKGTRNKRAHRAIRYKVRKR